MNPESTFGRSKIVEWWYNVKSNKYKF